MKIKSIVLSVLLVPVLAHAKLNVVATTPELAAIARDIAGNRAEVVSLAKPTEDTHFVDPKPSFVRKLASADLVVEGGAELEIGWLPPLMEGARNPKLAHLAIAPGIPPTPASLAEVITKMKAEHLKVIIVEPYQNRKTADTVAAETGATVVPVTQYPGGVKGTEGGYVELIDYLVNALAKELAK